MTAYAQHFVQTALARSPVMAAIDPAEVAALARAASLRRYPKRANLAGTAPHAPDLYLVMQGQAEYVTTSMEGEQVTLVAFGPGSWVNWLAVLAPTAIERQVEVAAGSTLVVFPAHLVRSVLARHPQAYLPLYRELGSRFRALMEWVERSALSRGALRVANLLVLLAQMGGASAPPHRVQMSQAQLARLSDCSRQSLNVHLRDLRALGLIETGYGKVTIIDLAGLKRLSVGS